MASITTEFDADHIFSSMDYRNENAALWNIESYPTSFVDGVGGDQFEIMPREIDDTLLSSILGMSFAEVPSGMDMAQPYMPEFDVGLCSVTDVQSWGAQFQPENNEFSGKCNEFVPDYQPTYGGSDPWGCQGNLLSSIEETSIKVRPYSVEERKDRIHRYLQKRNQRNFNKTIKYACRKALADRRIRVRGRFARNNELGEEPITTKNNNIRQEEEYYDDNPEVKHNGDEWLQEAVTSLMYLPIFAG